MKRHIARLLFVLAALTLGAERAAAQESLPVLAQVGPWPALSKLIVFDGRLWMANSVKGRNHNSADLYSLDPASGVLHYEHHLFSQDAGDPLVADGWLYWPFEDARFSLGWGQFVATDGTAWRQGTIPGRQIFHNHAMALDGADLVAATSAWRATLQRSSDGGRTWTEIYEHPTPPGRVSRIVSLLPFAGGLAGELVRRGESGPVHILDGRLKMLPGWPVNRRARSLAVLKGWLYGLVRTHEDLELWRSDGASSERLDLPAGAGPALALAASNNRLWLATAENDGALLWHCEEAIHWEAAHSLARGHPDELLIAGDAVFAAGKGFDGRGILWGHSGPLSGSDRQTVAPVRVSKGDDGLAIDWHGAGMELDRLLANPDTYRSHRGVLRDLVYRYALADPPPDFFTDRLERTMARTRLSLIGGAVEVGAEKVGRWVLLWGMSLAGNGRVPLSFIEEPWTAPANPSEKYFETAPAALWTIGVVGQNDRETIDVLIGRLGRPGDPEWLRGDVVGALTAVTGQRHGYDLDAWQAWWNGARNGWP